MIPIDMANLISASLPGNVKKNIVREGQKIKMLFIRGSKQITIHIEPNKITMKKKGNLIKIPYKKEKVIETIKKEFPI